MNKIADYWAGHAAAADPTQETVEWLFTGIEPPDKQMSFSWQVPDAEETVSTAEVKKVVKRWHQTAVTQMVERVRAADTMGGAFLTADGAGRHLLQRSRRIRPWTAVEERRWMQLVGRVFPVNSYLRRIDKHPTGHCPWCPGVVETITHFQSECPQFADNRTAAHHSIARAVMGALKDCQPKNWEFHYEHTIDSLPLEFRWASPREKRKQLPRRPDGVARNTATGTVLFLEFTRCMDHAHSLKAAVERKEVQYAEAVSAFERASRHRGGNALAFCVPLVFGVRGSVAWETAMGALEWVDIKEAQREKVLAAGVRAAITAAADMCGARFAALRKVVKPRRRRGQPRRDVIPQKPFRCPGWRADRGGAT